MNRNTVLAIGLSAVVILVFQLFFAPNPMIHEKAKKTTQVAKEKAPATAPAPAPEAKAEQPKQEPAAAEVEPTAPVALKTFEVSSGHVNYVFNSNTGNIRSATVQKFNGRTLKDIGFSSGKSDVVFANIPHVRAYQATIAKGADKTVVTFSGENGNIVVTKKYTINNKSFLIKANVTVTNTGDTTANIPLVAGIGPHAVDAFHPDRYAFQGPVIYNGKRLKKEKASKVKANEPVQVEKPVWVAAMSKYYMVAVAEDFQKGEIKKSGDSAVSEGQNNLVLNPGDRVSIPMSIFAGPKEYDILKSYGLKLEKSIDFGIFSFLAIPMLKFLKIIYGFVHNYGVAIILLTVIVKAVTFPLTQKSMVSMRKMSSLGPKMQEIKEKFKGDKERINQATMELYKKEGVNPLGGCLPMFLQIPIFFALYRTLLLSIELQGAPFMFWIQDLAAKDPYYITPVLMGITMFLQQRMTPNTATDPLQKKLFMYMPVIFTFLFLTFPAGLVVYWLTNNLLSIAQQYYINKKIA